MTTTTRPLSAGNGMAPGVRERLRLAGVNRRRRWPRVAAGAALAIACGCVMALLYGSAGHRVPVLAISRPVAVGEAISASDLTTVRIPSSAGLSPVPAEDASAVVGRTAAVELVPGTLLTGADLAKGPELGPGQASVGLNLKPGEVPDGLVPGATVMVVQVPAANGSPTGSQAASVLVDDATVLSVVPPSETAGNGNTEVTLALAAPFAAQVAAAGATGQIALVGLGSGGRS